MSNTNHDISSVSNSVCLTLTMISVQFLTMSGRRQYLSTAQISQVIDETIWKEKIAHERKAKEYWDNIYRSDIMKDALPVRARNFGML